MTEYILDLTAFDGETLDDGLREEIVRCRDCECFHADKHYGDECFRNSYLYDPSGEGLDIAVGGTFKVNPDGFCAWAVKRKEGGE